MSLGNTAKRYGTVALSLHWIMAALMIALLAMGLYMTGLPDGDDKWSWYDLHKSLGVTVLLLALVRLAWRARGPIPDIPRGLKPLEYVLAGVVHGYLYGAMLVLPLSGYVDSSTGGYHLSWFGLFEIPMLLPKNQTQFELAAAVHRWIGYGLIAVLVLHVGAVLKHHFVLKDDVLRRMLPGK